MTTQSKLDRIDSQRDQLDPNRPLRFFLEDEPTVDAHVPARVLTILLTSSRCALRCRMCDLWQETLRRETPLSAISTQIRWTLGQIESTRPEQQPTVIKLYNSGNFFDPRATPRADEEAILSLCEPFDRVIVENHPRIGVQRMLEFAKRLKPKLEVAVGLESVAPRALKRLDKQMTRDQFDQFARTLNQQGIDLRVFLIHGLPWMHKLERMVWTQMSILHSAAQSARHISLIPFRPHGDWEPKRASATESDIEKHVDEQEWRDLQVWVARQSALHGRCSVTMDPWEMPDWS